MSGHSGISDVILTKSRLSHNNLGHPSFEIFISKKCGMSTVPKLNRDHMVYAGFRQDIQDPPEAQSARASPNPHDKEYMDSRPDQEEIEKPSTNS